MSELDKQIEEAQAEVDTLRSQLSAKRKDIEEIDRSIAAMESAKEQAVLEAEKVYKRSSGFSYSSENGLLVEAKKTLVQLQRDKADESARLVVFETLPWGDTKAHVVDKITKKRIYIRPKGKTGTTYCDRETGIPAYGWKMDLAATFPEGVEKFAAAAK